MLDRHAQWGQESSTGRPQWRGRPSSSSKPRQAPAGAAGWCAQALSSARWCWPRASSLPGSRRSARTMSRPPAVMSAPAASSTPTPATTEEKAIAGASAALQRYEQVSFEVGAGGYPNLARYETVAVSEALVL